MYLKKVLVTHWEKIDGVWQLTRKLRDVSTSSFIVFDSDEMCSEDSYIRDVEFIYDSEGC